MTSRVHLATIEPAGIKHYCGLGYADDIAGGDRFELRWQRDNDHDSQALELFHLAPGGGMVKCGYIPRPLNQALLNLLRAGFELHLVAPKPHSLSVHIEMDKHPRS